MDLIKTNTLKDNKYNETHTTNSIKHFPVSTREWNNSIYAFNKNAIDLIPVASLTASKIIKSYFQLFNFNLERKIRSRRLSLKRRKNSKNKIFIGNSEFKHTNNKVIVNLYLFNRQERSYFVVLKKKYNRWKKLRWFEKRKINSKKTTLNSVKYNFRKKTKIIKSRKINKTKKTKKYVSKNKKKEIKWTDHNIYFYKKINYLIYILNNFTRTYQISKIILLSIINKKPLDEYSQDIILKNTNKIVNKMDQLSEDIELQALYTSLISSSKKNDLIRLDKFFNKYKTAIRYRYLKKLESYFYYRQLVYINKTKFNYNFLLELKKELENVFSKNVEFNLIRLKRFYFSSDILSESIKMKLTKNRRRIFRHLSKLKNKVRIRFKNRLFSRIWRSNSIKNNIFKKEYIQKISMNKLKYRDITGYRLEAKGRLTRRNTASRSVKKMRCKGNLLNLESSIRGLSSVVLRGNLQSNLQFTKSKSKTKIGSYGLKGWVSAN